MEIPVFPQTILGGVFRFCPPVWLALLLLGSFPDQGQTPAGQVAGAVPAKEPLKVEGHALNAVSGEPLRRVTLTLSPIDHAGTPRTSVSDAQGRFVFEGIAAGTYRLAAERTGFLRSEYGARKTESPGVPIVVDEARSAIGLDVRLTPQAVITGKVVDEEGEPVPHVDVAVFRRAGFGRVRRLAKVDASATNDVGDFRIAGLEPGAYFLAANGSDASPVAQSNQQPEEMYVASFYPGAADSAGALPVRIDAGQEVSGMDIQLQKSRVYRVRGKVVGSLPGVPLKGLEMRLLPKNATDAMPDVSPLIAFSSADGTFEFRGVQPGSYQLSGVKTQGGTRLLGKMPVEVTASHVENLRFNPDDGVSLTGSVHFEGDSGPPFQGAAAIVHPPDGDPNFSLSASISEIGQFRFEGISRDEYRLDFLHLPEDCYIKSSKLNGQSAMGPVLDLGAAQDAARLEITLSCKGGMAEGTVRAEDQLAAANVFLEPEPGAARSPFHSRRVPTGPDGRFRIRGVAPGRYLLFALPEETGFPWGLDTDLVESLRERGTKIQIDEGSHQMVELELLRPSDSGQ